MLKLAKLTDYATMLLTLMASEPSRRYSAQELAERSHLPPATAAKLLKQLARGGLVQSLRGAHGGYRLAKGPEQITIAGIVDVMEGPIAVTSCSVHSGDCSIEPSCAARANWPLINAAIREALDAVNLAQMAAPIRVHSTERPLRFLRSAPAVARAASD